MKNVNTKANTKAATKTNTKATIKPVAAKKAKLETGAIPVATVKGQGSVDARKLKDGTQVTTKAGQARAIILKHFNEKTPNSEECIKLIQALGFKRGLARTYFANNLPKVFPNAVPASTEVVAKQETKVIAKVAASTEGEQEQV